MKEEQGIVDRIPFDAEEQSRIEQEREFKLVKRQHAQAVTLYEIERYVVCQEQFSGVDKNLEILLDRLPSKARETAESVLA